MVMPNPGFFGGIGVEFFRKKPVGFGLEFGYDTSEVELEKKSRRDVSDTENINTVGLMLSIYAVF